MSGQPQPRFSRRRLLEAARSGDIGGLRAELETSHHRPRKGLRELLWRALVEASAHGRTLAAAYLIDRGAPVAKLQSRALSVAAGEGHLETVRLLLDKGALPNVETDLFLSAPARAAKGGHWEVLRLLLDRGARAGLAQALHWAAIRPDGLEAAGWLMDAGAEPFTSCSNALALALDAENAAAVRLLLARGANPDAFLDGDARERLAELLREKN